MQPTRLRFLGTSKVPTAHEPPMLAHTNGFAMVTSPLAKVLLCVVLLPNGTAATMATMNDAHRAMVINQDMVGGRYT
jgi:hypothetical protein